MKVEGYHTHEVGIYTPSGILTYFRWQDKTVQNFANLNRDFIYFFVEEECNA